MDQAMILLPLTFRFGLTDLFQVCRKIINRLITPELACQLFDNIHSTKLFVTSQMCVNVMSTQTQGILANGSLMQMQDSALCKILAHNELNINCESDLFWPMLDWADKQCISQELEINGINRREILKKRIYFIRFGAMNADAFQQCVAKVGPGFFTAEEVSSIMLSICLPTELSIQQQSTFNSERRICRIEFTKIDRGVTLEKSLTECIVLRSPSDKVSLVGFEMYTNDVVNRILTTTKFVNHGFVQSQRRVDFTDPLEFNADGECSFTIQLSLKSCFTFRCKIEKEKRVQIKAESMTIIKTILYR